MDMENNIFKKSASDLTMGKAGKEENPAEENEVGEESKEEESEKNQEITKEGQNKESESIEKMLEDNKEKIIATAENWLSEEEKRLQERIKNFKQLGQATGVALVVVAAVATEMLGLRLNATGAVFWGAVAGWAGGKIGEAIGGIIERKKGQQKQNTNNQK